MKDYPQNPQQWADEAYQSMRLAWTVLTQQTPFPSETQKQALIDMAANHACENRDIHDTSYIEHARTAAKDNFMADFNSRDVLQEINFALCYVLAYFDAHLSLSMITDNEADAALQRLKTDFDLRLPEAQQNNVFSMNYTAKH